MATEWFEKGAASSSAFTSASLKLMKGLSSVPSLSVLLRPLLTKVSLFETKIVEVFPLEGVLGLQVPIFILSSILSR